MTDRDLHFLLFVVAFIAVCCWNIWRSSKSYSILRRWASENRFEILSSEQRNLWVGPFFWKSSNAQTIYYVKVRDETGGERRGWVKCGGVLLGNIVDRAVVIWDEDN